MKTLSLYYLTIAAALAAAPTILAQETIEQRLDRLDRENRDLRQRLDALAPLAPLAPLPSADPTLPGAPESVASVAGFRKVYATENGVSLAGYGEFLFTQNSGRTDVADALRTVLYVGYRFDDKWLLHSEIELEHGSTSDASGTTTSGGEVSLEFGYVEYLAGDSLSLRAGMVLMPVGLMNEQHEPTLFLPAARSQTETRILPTTWREIGVEAIATFGNLEAKLFVGTGLDGEDFNDAGLRSGRQKGNRAAADDIATALRIDYRLLPELLVGASTVYQKAGQDGLRGSTRIPEMDTVIAEAHVDYRLGPWTLRGLYATAFSDDATQFASATGRNLAERMYGAYGEIGCDIAPWLLPSTRCQVTPFVRYEHIDTQAKMPDGVAANAALDSVVLTFGVNYRPHEQIVFKLDYEDWSDNFDRLSVAMGYVF